MNQEYVFYKKQILEQGPRSPLLEKLRDRVRGSLLAGAAGDALGYTVEFMSVEQIRRQYGPQGIARYTLRDGKARFSDDTQMTLFTAVGLLHGARNRAQMEPTPAVYQAYLAWLRTQGYAAEVDLTPWELLMNQPELHKLRAPGNTCLSALRSGTMGTPERPINNSKGCGGVMRTAPAGMLPVFRETPLMVGARAGAITHGHPMGYIPAGMLSDLIYRLLYTEYGTLYGAVEQSLETVCHEFATCPEVKAFRALIRRAMELSRENRDDVETIHALGGGWVGDEALAIAIYGALKYETDLDACLRATVNHSGDADSTGAIAGNILGAHLGLPALPQWFRQELELEDLILAVVDGLVQAAVLPES